MRNNVKTSRKGDWDQGDTSSQVATLPILIHKLVAFRKPAFLKLRAQLVQFQLGEYALESASMAAGPSGDTDASCDTLQDASNGLPHSLPADTRSNSVGESPDFVPEENSIQISGAQVIPDVNTMGYLAPLPPKP